MNYEQICSTWLVQRIDQGGGYLAPAGSPKSWIKTKAAARRFPSYEAALAECCDNERPVRL